MDVLGQLRRQGTENARTDSRDAGVLFVELFQARPNVANTGHHLRMGLDHAQPSAGPACRHPTAAAAETGPVTALHDLVSSASTAR